MKRWSLQLRQPVPLPKVTEWYPGPTVKEFDWDAGYQDFYYFCTSCGETWAWAIKHGHERKYALQTLCPYHDWPTSDTGDIPGDLFLPFESDYNGAIASLAIPLLNWVWATRAPIEVPQTTLYNYIIQGQNIYVWYDTDSSNSPPGT